MEFDAATAQYYDRARYYGASIGRFTGQDPLGFGSGDVNVYRYVQNGPTNQIDSTGMYAAGITQATWGYMSISGASAAYAAAMASGVLFAALELAYLGSLSQQWLEAYADQQKAIDAGNLLTLQIIGAVRQYNLILYSRAMAESSEEDINEEIDSLERQYEGRRESGEV